MVLPVPQDKKDMPIVGSGRNGVTALQFDNHLFNPIFYMNNEDGQGEQPRELVSHCSRGIE